MFVHLTIHYPKKGKRKKIAKSLIKVAAAIEDQLGCREAHILEDEDSDKVIGLAIWEHKKDWKRKHHLMEEAIKHEDFEEWEEREPEVCRLHEIL